MTDIRLVRGLNFPVGNLKCWAARRWVRRRSVGTQLLTLPARPTPARLACRGFLCNRSLDTTVYVMIDVRCEA